MRDYRLHDDYSDTEIILHNCIVTMLKNDSSIHVQKALKKLGKPDDIDCLSNVIKQIFCLSDESVIHIITQAKKKWRKK